MTNSQLAKSTKLKAPKPATPWVQLVCPNSENIYKLRLEMHRHGGSVHIRMHDASPTCPGKHYIVRNTRPGFMAFVDAARGLLRASRWERHAFAGKHAWRTVWHAASVDYPLRMQYAQTVALHLDPVVNPRMGRPTALTLTEARAARGRGLGGVRSGVAQARANRRVELLRMESGMRNLLLPMVEKVGSARSLTGYTGEERRQLVQLLAELEHGLTVLRDVVFNNKFRYTDTATPADTLTPASMHGDPTAPVSFDDLEI